MKIEDKRGIKEDRKTFDSIAYGSVYELDGVLFYKTKPYKCMNHAINLTNNEPVLLITGHTLVKPIKAKIVLED